MVWGGQEGESHLFDVPGECELELAAGQVPYLDGAVRRAGHKPLVAAVKRQAPHPPAQAVQPHQHPLSSTSKLL